MQTNMQQEEKKNIYFTMRCTEAEREAYHALARAEKRPLSDVIRTVLTERAATVKRS